MSVVPLREDQPVPVEPRKLIVSRIEGHREWSNGGSYQMIASADGTVELVGRRESLSARYQMIAAADGSIELIGPRKTVRVTNGERLVRVLGRFDMQPWTEDAFTVRWVHGDANGGPPDPYMGGGRAQYWLWLDITTGVIPPHYHNGVQTNPTSAGKPAVDHMVLANSSAQYHGRKLREAFQHLARYTTEH